MPVETPPHPLPPELTTKYEMLGKLGSGAMGVVFEAVDRNIERRVAIKVVQRPSVDDTDAQEAHARFRREAQAAGRLAHPNIVGVYDYGESPECAWIVMEFVEGGTLKSYFDREERFPLPEIVRLMNQILGALAYSHARGVVHRDIKPANIMLSPDGTGGLMVKIADFGIARIENSSMTQVGTVMGTPSYMAPEQLRGETVDSRADLWAAGVVLYQLLTAEKPFTGGYTAVLHKALNTEATPPSQISVTAPRAFDQVMVRALAKRPADRFTTAADFAVAIRAAASEPADASGMLVRGAEGTMAAAPAAWPTPDLAATLAPGSIIATSVIGSVAGMSAPGSAAATPAPGRAAATPAAPSRKGLPLAALGGVAAAAVLALAWFGMGPGRTPQPPTVIAPAAPAPAPDYAAAARAIAALPCSLIQAQPGGAGLRLSGLTRRENQAALRQALTQAQVPEAAVQGQVESFDGPFCAVLDQLRNRAGGAPTGALVGTLPMQKGDLVRFDLSMPDRAGQLAVTYLLNSGQVAHIVPPQPMAPGARQRFGEPAPGFEGWVVDEPYGTDLLVVVLSDQPLYAAPRPMVERIDEWLAALAGALGQAEVRGNRVAAMALVVPTQEAR